MPGFIKLPRDFLAEPLWINLQIEFQHIFIVILESLAFEPCKFDDHGMIVELQPGQVCITIRELQSRCHKSITKSKVERGIKKLKLIGFLHQEIINTKNILTVIDKRFTPYFSVTYKSNKKEVANYQNLLTSEEWKAFSKKVKDKAEWKCEKCGVSDKTLHAHHLQYVKGRKPWQYNISLMQCLCEDCHTQAHSNTKTQ